MTVESDEERPEQDARVRLRSTGLGYTYVAESAPRDGETPVYIHRLAAIAWGTIESLSDPDHIHHEVPEEWLGDDRDRTDAGIPWLNVEDAIRAEERDDHAKIHFGGDR
jgi:hypothetical protein